MKKTILLKTLILTCFMIASSLNYYIVEAMPHSGPITGPETWHADDNPHYITAHIEIYDNGFVEIETGCEITVGGNIHIYDGGELKINEYVLFTFSFLTNPNIITYKIEISGSGKMTADGTVDAPITFTGNPTYGWLGIFFNTNTRTSILDWCIINNVKLASAVKVTDSDDITISNCEISSNSNNSNGGGVYWESSDGTIEHNTIQDNTCTSFGGGIYCDGTKTSGQPIIEDNEITYNNAEAGGGINCFDCTADIQYNYINYNYASGRGGGISIKGSNASPTISNNYEIIHNKAEWSGGGINIAYNATPEISNNTISFNRVLDRISSLTRQDFGGGGISIVDYSSGGTIDIDHNTIEGNEVFIDENTSYAGNGGGIYINTNTSTVCNIIDNSITNTNYAYNNGGGICIVNTPGLTTIKNINYLQNSISQNYCYGNGGGIYVENSYAIIQECKILGNTSLGEGGGIFYSGLISNNDLIFIVMKNTISDNTSYGNGGGLYVENVISPDKMLIRLNYIENNIASYSGGGIYADDISSYALEITNNLIDNCEATDGAGIYFDDNISDPYINNNTIADNTASNDGGGIYSVDRTGSYVNNIIWGNTANSSANSANSSLSDPYATYPDFYYCDIEGASPSGTGSISSDPIFDPAPSYRVRYNNSPCRDVGYNSVSPVESVDLDNDPRFDDLNELIDMGAYENNSNNPYIIMPGKLSVNSASNKNNYFNIYPNPATEQTKIYLYLVQKSSVSIELINSDGKIISFYDERCYEPGNYLLNVDFSKLNTGLYLCRFIIKHNTTTEFFSRKLIKY